VSQTTGEFEERALALNPVILLGVLAAEALPDGLEGGREGLGAVAGEVHQTQGRSSVREQFRAL